MKNLLLSCCFVLVSLCSVVFLSCSGDGSSSKPMLESLSFDLDSTKMYIDKTIDLSDAKIIATYDDGSTRKIKAVDVDFVVENVLPDEENSTQDDNTEDNSGKDDASSDDSSEKNEDTAQNLKRYSREAETQESGEEGTSTEGEQTETGDDETTKPKVEEPYASLDKYNNILTAKAEGRIKLTATYKESGIEESSFVYIDINKKSAELEIKIKNAKDEYECDDVIEFWTNVVHLDSRERYVNVSYRFAQETEDIKSSQIKYYEDGNDSKVSDAENQESENENSTNADNVVSETETDDNSSNMASWVIPALPKSRYVVILAEYDGIVEKKSIFVKKYEHYLEGISFDISGKLINYEDGKLPYSGTVDLPETVKASFADGKTEDVIPTYSLIEEVNVAKKKAELNGRVLVKDVTSVDEDGNTKLLFKAGKKLEASDIDVLINKKVETVTLEHNERIAKLEVEQRSDKDRIYDGYVVKPLRTGKIIVVAEYTWKTKTVKAEQEIEVRRNKDEMIRDFQSFSVEPKECTLGYEESQAFTATATYKNKNVTPEEDEVVEEFPEYVCLDEQYASCLSKDGKFSAPTLDADATTKIKATFKDVPAAEPCEMTVTIKKTDLVGIKSIGIIFPDNWDGKLPETDELSYFKAKVVYENGFEEEITPNYFSADATYLKCDDDVKKITAIKAKKDNNDEFLPINVTAKWTRQGKSIESEPFEIIVIDKTVVTGLDISATSFNNGTVILKYNEDTAITVTAHYNNRPDAQVLPEIACKEGKIEDYGEIKKDEENNIVVFKSKSSEDAIINLIFTFEGATASLKLTLREAELTGLAFKEGETPPEKTNVGLEFALPTAVQATYADGKTKDVVPKYTVNDEELASIKGGSLFTAIKEGDVVVTAIYEEGEYTESCDATIHIKPAALTGIYWELSKSVIKTTDGDNKIDLPSSLRATYTDKNVRNVPAQEDTFTSSDAEIVRVDAEKQADGSFKWTATGLKEGDVLISATYTEGEGDDAITMTYAYPLTVSDKTVKKVALILTPDKTDYVNGETITLKATATINDGTNDSDVDVNAHYKVTANGNDITSQVGLIVDAVNKTAIMTVPGFTSATQKITITAEYGGIETDADTTTDTQTNPREITVSTKGNSGVMVDFGN